MSDARTLLPPEASPSAAVVHHLLHGLTEFAMFALSPSGDVSSWSVGSAALTGFAAADALGRPFSTFFSAGRPDAAKVLLHEAESRGEAILEARWNRSDGTWFSATGVVSALPGEQGVQGYVVVARDVTERRRAEEALRVAEATSQGILAISADAVICVSEDQRITLFNQGAEKMFGYQAADVLGEPLELLVPDYVRDRHAQHVRDFGASGVSARRMGERGEISGRRKDGTVFPAEASISKLEVGGKTVFTAVVRDVTERRRAEEALRIAEATSQGILAISADAVVCVSADQRITLFNRGAEKLFGYLADEVLGEPLETLVPDYVRGRHAQHVRDFGASGVASRRMGERGEISGRRKDGSVFPADASISRLEVAGKTIFTAVVRDATERRRAAEELGAHAEELARSNEDLQQFAYVASHDLQEPLRMVASYTQLLARRYQGKLDADADEFIGFAVDGVTRMQALINDLLAYSRAGSRDSSRTLVPLNEVLDKVLRTLATSIGAAGAVVTCDRLPTVWGDAGQLAQVLQNLIGNAIKFRGADPPRVHVSAQRIDGEWQISVRDNGIGIAPEFTSRIFVIFQRLHSRNEYPGTGIGLAICRKIVERHDGRIWVDSEPGHGTTFHFTLPDRKAGAA